MSKNTVGDYEKAAEADYEALGVSTSRNRQSVFASQKTGKCIHCGDSYTFGNYLMSDGAGAYHAKCAIVSKDVWWLK
ncbi:MAG: hypothetical protein HOD58_16645 [Gammaproteobacteria bacterium]|jgi:hypothetical protein|nr:hypothetical protein [Gammaproteobacteria bacterium]